MEQVFQTIKDILSALRISIKAVLGQGLISYESLEFVSQKHRSIFWKLATKHSSLGLHWILPHPLKLRKSLHGAWCRQISHHYDDASFCSLIRLCAQQSIFLYLNLFSPRLLIALVYLVPNSTSYCSMYCLGVNSIVTAAVTDDFGNNAKQEPAATGANNALVADSSRHTCMHVDESQ